MNNPSDGAVVTGTEMDPEAMVFRGKLTEADMVELCRCQDRMIVRRPYRRLAKGFAAFIGATMIAIILAKGASIGPVLGMLGCAYIFLLPIERAWLARRKYRKNETLHIESEVRMDANRIHISNASQQTEFDWKLLNGVADAPAGIMLHNELLQAICWLPARSLDGNDSRERIIALALYNGVRVRQVR